MTGFVGDVWPDFFFLVLMRPTSFIYDALNHRESQYADRNSVYLTKISHLNFDKRMVSKLDWAQRETSQENYVVNAPTADLIRAMYEIPHDTTTAVTLRKEERKRHQLQLFNPNLDQSKLEAVAKCAECDPITIIHGPPGSVTCCSFVRILC